MARDVELLPDGTDPSDFSSDTDDEDFDLSTLTVNFSTEEAGSEARTYEVVPTGEYYCRIFNVSVARSKSDKNPGKPYYRLELVIQNGKYERQHLWTNVMLFDGALYTLAQLHKALDWPMDGTIIPASSLQARELVAVVQKVRDKYAAQRDGWVAGDGPHPMKAEVRGFKKYIPGVTGQPSAAAKGVEASGSGSLLP